MKANNKEQNPVYASQKI